MILRMEVYEVVTFVFISEKGVHPVQNSRNSATQHCHVLHVDSLNLFDPTKIVKNLTGDSVQSFAQQSHSPVRKANPILSPNTKDSRLYILQNARLIC